MLAAWETIRKFVLERGRDFRQRRRRVVEEDSFDQPPSNSDVPLQFAEPQFEEPSGVAVQGKVKWFNPSKGTGSSSSRRGPATLSSMRACSDASASAPCGQGRLERIFLPDRQIGAEHQPLWQLLDTRRRARRLRRVADEPAHRSLARRLARRRQPGRAAADCQYSPIGM